MMSVSRNSSYSVNGTCTALVAFRLWLRAMVRRSDCVFVLDVVGGGWRNRPTQ
jgi:hypothetical protein